MPATTSDLLLNTLPSVNKTPSRSFGPANGASFSEHWAEQSQLGQKASGASNSAARESSEHPRRNSNEAARNNSGSSSNSSEKDRPRSRVDNHQNESFTRQNSDRADNRSQRADQEGTGEVQPKFEKASPSERSEHSDANEVDSEGEVNGEALAASSGLAPNGADHGDMSSEERFILALLGVSVAEPVAKADALSDGSRLAADLDLEDASMFTDDEAAVELETENLSGVDLLEDQQLTVEEQAKESIVGEIEPVQAILPGNVAKSSDSGVAKTVDTELAGKLASLNRQGPSISISQEASVAPIEEGDAELISETIPISSTDSKLKSANAELAPVSKLAANQLFREVSSAPSASAYGESNGVSHSQSLGRASGMEHNFQLQRGADVQGRSTMQSDIGQAQWKAEIAEKVAWFSARNISKAEIRLDPPELGSLQIKIQLNQEQAQVSFNSPHASVREALDQSSSRLREMFQEQGLNLADVNVGGDGAQQHAEDGEKGTRSAFDEDVADTELAPKPQLQSLALVDSYV
ncbi:flagellar hook-length control protein FliK [uncultured Pseudoteredinibacter sp.]|uniref:flagellar hook-length control protein FliK n=1 Tax=uncultured Pseudoteredinibacter sp. TaxID=1641701 RepID=UPI00263775C4|nr:flagellar hook-length control protein FliK [uncultured Pseudoteredinibacter sp.]